MPRLPPKHHKQLEISKLASKGTQLCTSSMISKLWFTVAKITVTRRGLSKKNTFATVAC